MNILILGSGGREHAIAWKIAQNKKVNKLYIAPGNAGTKEVGENIDIHYNNFDKIKKFVLDNSINIVFVGPEEPLVNGISDYFKSNRGLKNIPVIGPCKQGAMLEGSKDFAKQFMEKYSIPTARYKSFTKESYTSAVKFLDELPSPYVLKVDGLAAGKGVVILDSLKGAKNELKEIFNGKFGQAGQKVIIEEFLKGIEISVFIITDGESYKILPEAKDYKRILEGDKGLNTGGMGAVSPVPFANGQFMQKVEDRVVKPTMQGLQKENIQYKGFIFFGLMNVSGDPYVIEYNVRLGDPEAEVVIPRIKSDLVDLLEGVAQNNLKEKQLEIDKSCVVTVMLVSKGYPSDYKKNKIIYNLDKVSQSIIFHAGTKTEGKNILTNGGRVIALSSYGVNKKDALSKSYNSASIIEFDGKYYRKDIGFDL